MLIEKKRVKAFGGLRHHFGKRAAMTMEDISRDENRRNRSLSRPLAALLAVPNPLPPPRWNLESEPRTKGAPE